jgi:hypothetical protein
VRVALAHFLTDEARKRQAKSRGGGRQFVSLEDADALELHDTKGRSPDQILDDLWRDETLRQAAALLERELVAEGKAKWWALFDDHIRADSNPTHAELAERHGISRIDVQNWLARCRVRYREALIQIVGRTVDGDNALAEELAWLLEERAS